MARRGGKWRCRYRHVRWAQSISGRALGGDCDPGRLYRLWPGGAGARRIRRQPPPAAGRRCRVPGCRHLDHAFHRRHGRADPRRRDLPRPADHRLLPDLRAGGRRVAVLPERRRAFRGTRDRHRRCCWAAASCRCTMSAFTAWPVPSPSSTSTRWSCSPPSSPSALPMAACASSWRGRWAGGSP